MLLNPSKQDGAVAENNHSGKQYAVQTVHHAAMAGEDGAKILYLAVALDHAGEQIAHLRCHAAYQRSQNGPGYRHAFQQLRSKNTKD